MQFDGYEVEIVKSGEVELPPWVGTWSHPTMHLGCGAEYNVSAVGVAWMDIEGIWYNKFSYRYEMKCPCCGNIATKSVSGDIHYAYLEKLSD